MCGPGVGVGLGRWRFEGWGWGGEGPGLKQGSASRLVQSIRGLTFGLTGSKSSIPSSATDAVVLITGSTSQVVANGRHEDRKICQGSSSGDLPNSKADYTVFVNMFLRPVDSAVDIHTRVQPGLAFG